MWDSEASPPFESSPLRILAEQAGQKVTDDFFRTYLELLPARSGRIVHGLAAGDTDVALDALVSLKVTSAMVGAVQLEKYSWQLEQQIRTGGGANLTEVKTVLSENIRRFLHEAVRQGDDSVYWHVIRRSRDD